MLPVSQPAGGSDDEHDHVGHGHSHSHSHGHGHGDQGHSGSHGHEEGHGGENINMRGAVLHIIGDLVQSIGVAAAGALIWWKQVGRCAADMGPYMWSGKLGTCSNCEASSADRRRDATLTQQSLMDR